MPTVDAFESSAPEQKLAEDAQAKFDYSQLSEAFVHVDVGGLEMVENIYARCAKHHFRKLMLGRAVIHDEEGPELDLIYVTGMDLVMKSREVQLDRIYELTEALAYSLTHLSRGQMVLLDGALSSRVIKVGSGIYKFALKQRWGLR